MRTFLIILFFLFNLTKINAVVIPMIDYLDIDNGLSNNSVRYIYQDHKGFMWFGTRDGLNRYDGYGFKVFRNKFNVSNSLVSNSVTVIINDEINNLWIGTLHGLSAYNDLYGRFTTIKYKPFNKLPPRVIKEVIKDVKTDQYANVLIATEGLGLIYCKKGAFVASQIPLINPDGTETTVYGVQTIKLGQDHKTWVFVQNLGLCMLDYKTMKLRLINANVPLALCMEIDGSNIWIGTTKGLYKYQSLTNKMEKIFQSADGILNSNRIISLKLDELRNLWIGTYDKGINIYNLKENKITFLQSGDDKYALGSGAVYAIYIDKDSRKWIGTSLGGVSRVDPQKNRFQTITHEPGNKTGLSGNAISSFYEDFDHKLWIGTENSGLNVWDRKNNSFKNYKNIPGNSASLSGNFITSILADYKHDIWLGSFSDGISRYNRSADNFKRYKCINPATGIESNVVSALHEDRKKNIWTATLRQGSLFGALYRFNRGADKFDLFDTKLTDLFTINEDLKGDLWGGNLNQLVQIDTVHKKHQFYPVGYIVRAIHPDSKGNLWVGTEDGGLLLFDTKLKKIVKRYTREDGLCSNTILTILDDENGNFWISTYNGITEFNFSRRTFKNFYQNDGLQSNQFQIGAALKLRSGEMVFGGIKGFNIFHSSSIVPINHSPKLLLTGLMINNTPVELDPSFIKTANDRILELKVPYNKAVFSFVFTALEYSTPNKILYAYYMDGWDRGWNNTGNNRTAAYTHIDEGNYTFRVKCTNTEGVWINKELTLKIIVLPPWYRTWWAYLIYMGIAAGLIYVYVVYKAKQTKLQYEVKIAKLNAQREKAEYESARSEHEKERVINEKEKELNEKRLSFFTNISHEFRTPLTLIINPVKDLIGKAVSRQDEERKELTIIHRNARRMLSLVDQLLLFRKAETGLDNMNVAKLNFYDLCHEVYVCFVQQASSKNIRYDFIFENKEIQLFGDREKIEIILFNLISNALKYTPPKGSVVFKVTETAETVLTEVVDTGYGIPESAGDRLFDRFYQAKRKDHLSKPGFGIGLYLAKQFTEAHSGDLYYESELNLGTTFCLKLLKGTKHFTNTINDVANESFLLNELASDEFEEIGEEEEQDFLKENLISDKQSILIVDDEADIRQYIRSIFKSDYIVYEAENGENGLHLIQEKLPDLIITDFRMEGIDGIELCAKIKSDPALSYIPVILLTASSSKEIKLKSLEGGADDYIGKPFEKDYLVARVANLLKNRNNLQSYFYNEITLQSNTIIISEEYKKFLDKCIVIVEHHLNDPDFSVQSLSDEIGMSRSNLYKRVKSISGQSVTAFIRFIRLRKAAEIMINSDCNVNEVAFQTGFNDAKYFSKQFLKLFHSNPSEFIRKHRKSFNKRYKIKEELSAFKKN